MASTVTTVALRTGPTVSYSDQGDPSGPVLVLLPGPTDSWRSYEAVLEHVPSSIRAIAVSQRGHGDSDKPATGYRVENFSADALALLDALDVDRAVLAGHSGSCLVARRVAIDAPERVAGLVLEAAPTTLHGDMTLLAFFDSVVSELADPIDPDLARSLVADTSSPGVASEVLDQLVGEILKVPARVWREMFAELLNYDDRSQLSRISAPALLLWGSADGIVSRGMQDQLQECILRADLIVYEGLGHTPRWEDPIRFATDVTAFVERSLSTPS
jgi:non-heme chloroperoxidase